MSIVSLELTGPELLPNAIALNATGFNVARVAGPAMGGLLVAAVGGGGGILYFNASNTLVQLSVEDAFRGRVMSLYTLMQQGTATFGSLVLGVVAERYGTPLALVSGAALCLTAVAVFVLQSALEPQLHAGVTPVAEAD